jgi:hypothetical protein
MVHRDMAVMRSEGFEAIPESAEIWAKNAPQSLDGQPKIILGLTSIYAFPHRVSALPRGYWNSPIRIQGVGFGFL